MANCLITGHRGYIGRALFEKLFSMEHNIVGQDKKQENDGDILDGMYESEDYDNLDYIFHMACDPRVAFSVENPVYTMMNNVVSTSIVLDYGTLK